MIPVSEIRTGRVLRVEGQLAKILSFEIQGAAKAGRIVHAKLKVFVTEVKVASTGPGISGQADSTFKEAVLENGVQVMLPQFIREGDTVKVEVETGRYVDRVVNK